MKELRREIHHTTSTWKERQKQTREWGGHAFQDQGGGGSVVVNGKFNFLQIQKNDFFFEFL